ncbi:MAG: MFS transporter [Ruminococcaceae bacterium]|nr:MFS transporter [Oscillospiraceae bacterium]
MGNSILKIKGVFRKNSPFKMFLLSVLITGISYGLYKGMLDNFLAEVVNMGEMDRGVTEFFRELPGILLIFILAAFYMLSAESLYKAGALIMLVGMAMHAAFPATKIFATLAICTYSVGEHIQIGMKNTLSLKYANEGSGGAALGAQTAINQIGTLFGYLLVILAFSFAVGKSTYTTFFWVATALAGISLIFSMRISGRSETDKNKRRFYFHKKYKKYYMLEMFYGARKQVFLTFGPYVLIRFYGASTATISLLFAISAVTCFFASPLVGRIIDKLGYKVVMVADTIILVAVCFFYGFAHHVFPMHIAFIVCCVNYVLDAVISLASMASNLYVKDLSDNDEEVKATISTGVSINHVITIFIALFGGWIWYSLGIELLFITSAVLGLCNSAYAATVNAEKDKLCGRKVK